MNLGLVRKEAHHWKHQCQENFDDLMQIGSLGLIQAIERFDLIRQNAEHLASRLGQLGDVDLADPSYPRRAITEQMDRHPEMTKVLNRIQAIEVG